MKINVFAPPAFALSLIPQCNALQEFTFAKAGISHFRERVHICQIQGNFIQSTKWAFPQSSIDVWLWNSGLLSLYEPKLWFFSILFFLILLICRFVFSISIFAFWLLSFIFVSLYHLTFLCREEQRRCQDPCCLQGWDDQAWQIRGGKDKKITEWDKIVSRQQGNENGRPEWLMVWQKNDKKMSNWFKIINN